MSDATGTTTTNYAFKTLAAADRAGYVGINEIITSIDTLVNPAGLIGLFTGSVPPTGWTNVNTTITTATPGLAVAGYIWIKKA